MVLIVGHRGARNLWAENSLEGFRRTLDLGVDGVELDVHLSRDGELVVIHDPTLERTTEGCGPVHDKTAGELAATRLRDTAGEGVPHLEAVLDVFQETSVELHLEIKTDAAGRAYAGLERKLLEMIHRRRLGSRAIITCFVPQVLDAVRAVDARQHVLASLDRRSAELLGGIEPALDRFAAIEGCMVAVEKGLLSITLELCQRRLGRGGLGVWVPNEPEDIAHWLRQPVRQITTDRPDIALAQRQAI